MSVAQIEDLVRATLEAGYTALQSADNFTWQSLLDYRLSIVCPSDIEPLVRSLFLITCQGLIKWLE